MKITVRYFASVRERLGAGQDLTWSDDADDVPATVADLRQWLIGQSEVHAQTLSLDKGLRSALNQVMCPANERLVDGAEVAFFPPVTGG